MRIVLCSKCSLHYRPTMGECPHCVRSPPLSYRKSLTMVTTLLGLSLIGCGDKEEDTAMMDDSATQDTSMEETAEPPYGVGALDEDGDGFLWEEDCDDSDPFTFPGAAENDSTTECMKDSDGDGFGDDGTGLFVSGTDCNDNDATINPSASEVLEDGIDQDCDGVAQ